MLLWQWFYNEKDFCGALCHLLNRLPEGKPGCCVSYFNTELVSEEEAPEMSQAPLPHSAAPAGPALPDTHMSPLHFPSLGFPNIFHLKTVFFPQEPEMASSAKHRIVSEEKQSYWMLMSHFLIILLLICKTGNGGQKNCTDKIMCQSKRVACILPCLHLEHPPRAHSWQLGTHNCSKKHSSSVPG